MLWRHVTNSPAKALRIFVMSLSLSLTPSRESVTVISAFKGYGLPLPLNDTCPRQPIRTKRHYILFLVPCSYLHLPEILHYYRKIKFIAVTLKAISWTSLSHCISYQPILFNIILYFSIQYFKTNCLSWPFLIFIHRMNIRWITDRMKLFHLVRRCYVM
jgi:hypothetical protein